MRSPSQLVPVGLVLLVTSLGSCMPGSRPSKLNLLPVPPREAIAAEGCWEFILGPKALSKRLPAGTLVALRLQDSIHYPLSSIDTAFDKVSFRPMNEALERATRISLWSVDSASRRIALVIGDGFSGVGMTLEQRGDTLMGRARIYSDAWPWGGLPSHVRALRRTCAVDSAERAPSNDGCC